MSGDRSQLRLRAVEARDLGWLLVAGLRPQFVGVQYHWAETPLQLLIAPLRAILGPYVAARVIEVDGRRAGYIGRSPLSGNYEYFLLGWARGHGRGRRSIAQFLEHGRRGDKSRSFVIAARNRRSLRALLGALDEIGWCEGRDFRVKQGRWHTSVRVREDEREGVRWRSRP